MTVDPLYPFLNRFMARAFVWGECDCVTMPADWVQLRTGHDPAEGLRQTYASAAECQRVTRFFDDPVGVIGPRLAACGLHVTDQPRRGDVGIAALDISARPFGAICLDGEVWAFKADGRGVAALRPIEVIKAWSFAA